MRSEQKDWQVSVSPFDSSIQATSARLAGMDGFLKKAGQN
jgi:hypothetical protein